MNEFINILNQEIIVPYWYLLLVIAYAIYNIYKNFKGDK